MDRLFQKEEVLPLSAQFCLLLFLKGILCLPGAVLFCLLQPIAFPRKVPDFVTCYACGPFLIALCTTFFATRSILRIFVNTVYLLTRLASHDDVSSKARLNCQASLVLPSVNLWPLKHESERLEEITSLGKWAGTGCHVFPPGQAGFYLVCADMIGQLANWPIE